MTTSSAVTSDKSELMWSRADKAHASGRDAYIEFCMALAELNASGITQEAIGQRYGMKQSLVAYAVKIGRDKRIIANSNTSTLPHGERVLYLLTTLDDVAFKRFAKHDTTQDDINSYKNAQRAAKQKPKTGQQKPKAAQKRGWTQCIVDLGASYTALFSGSQSTDIKKQLEQHVGHSIPSYVAPEQESEIQTAFIAVFGEKRLDLALARPELSESAEKKLQRAIAVEMRRLQDSFADEVRKEVNRRIPDLIARYERDSAACVDERTRYAHLSAGIKKKITADEYRLLLGLLHPDKHPAEQQERYGRGFQIVMRLKEYAEA